MSVNRGRTWANCTNKASASRRAHRTSRAHKVLAERNPPVVSVGAWVEDGPDFLEHPFTLALLTEELQTERRRETEESLRRFQDEVRHRVAKQAQAFKKTQLPPSERTEKCNRKIPQPQYRIWTQQISAGEKLMSAGRGTEQRLMEGSSQESGDGMRQVRLRLAACQTIAHGEMMSDLPGGPWNNSLTKHKDGTLMLRRKHDMEEPEDVQEVEDDYIFTSQNKCPFIKASEHELWESSKSQPDAGFKSIVRVPQNLWPLTDQEELKRQRQSEFLMQRRLFMNTEREQVKENNQHRRHLKKTTRIKAEKERIRLEEERKLERARQLAEAQQRLEERELLILERLKLEKEERVVELQRRKREEKGKETERFIDALRAQIKERLCQEKMEIPPLCCCAASFWDTHPDTCANNCIFHNNPKAYSQALHSVMLSLD
ncbi:coiled-coil domain-containing protein 15 [Betta splendens]|uniref:Coiled-coil domain-containing protein 15 n=1 Tax=Betta splendens TaxID=158456 RepID=A0A6P7PVK7_BETSP|nr:coiled-coil domain-containing protein 15 [Betta splendens]